MPDDEPDVSPVKTLAHAATAIEIADWPREVKAVAVQTLMDAVCEVLGQKPAKYKFPEVE